MTRALFQSILLFVLPFLGWGLYLLLTRQAAAWLASTPWFVLSLAGLSLAVAGFVALVLTGNAVPDGIFVPPHLGPDGEVVPGRVIGRDAGS